LRAGPRLVPAVCVRAPAALVGEELLVLRRRQAALQSSGPPQNYPRRARLGAGSAPASGSAARGRGHPLVGRPLLLRSDHLGGAASLRRTGAVTHKPIEQSMQKGRMLRG
jgi:hypothetical protein